jgi:hypothetical protein
MLTKQKRKQNFKLNYFLKSFYLILRHKKTVPFGATIEELNWLAGSLELE